ncbi:MAG: NUDIX hydrolase [bacterium]
MCDRQKKEWKKLGSKLILKTPWLEISKNIFRLPDGKIIQDYYLIKKPTSVHFMAITEENKIILIKQYRPGAERATISVPAGYVDKDETLEQACQREMAEEIGYRAENLLEITQITEGSDRFVGFPCHLFMAWNLVKIENRKLDAEAEEINIIEISVEEAIKMIERKKIKGAFAIAAIFLAQRFIKKKKVK